MQGSSSFRLVVRRGPQPNQVYPLEQGIVTLGRDITNDIVINDPEVSRHHCRFTQSGGGYTLEDLGSTNGTFVNGQRLTGARPLAPGDMLGLGETVTLAYEVGAVYAAGPGQVATMASGVPQPGGVEFHRPLAGYSPQEAGMPPAGPGYPGAAVPGQQPYVMPMQQQPAGYDYQYQEEPYEGGGAGRWVVLGCGCFLVMCIVTSVIGGIIIDAKCWWDDIPVISETFNLGIREGATCR